MLWLYGQGWFLDFAVFGTDLRDLFQVHPVNLSVAVWVGFLALFGIATDDGVIIATYLRQTFERERPDSIEAIREATVHAGLRRIRPCLMTVGTTILALIPVLTSTGRGSDVMVPMAIPSFGGMTVVLITLPTASRSSTVMPAMAGSPGSTTPLPLASCQTKPQMLTGSAGRGVGGLITPGTVGRGVGGLTTTAGGGKVGVAVLATPATVGAGWTVITTTGGGKVATTRTIGVEVGPGVLVTTRTSGVLVGVGTDGVLVGVLAAGIGVLVGVLVAFVRFPVPTMAVLVAVWGVGYVLYRRHKQRAELREHLLRTSLEREHRRY